MSSTLSMLRRFIGQTSSKFSPLLQIHFVALVSKLGDARLSLSQCTGRVFSNFCKLVQIVLAQIYFAVIANCPRLNVTNQNSSQVVQVLLVSFQLPRKFIQQNYFCPLPHSELFINATFQR